MTRRHLILRSLRHFRRTHLGIFLGVMVSSMVLVGALMVGDSVRFSLRKIVLQRLGRTEFALTSEDRFFRAAWASEIADHSGGLVAPYLRFSGICLVDGGAGRANGIEILGVDHRFWEAGGASSVSLSPGHGAVSRKVAERLALEVGSEILLRTAKPGAMPAEAPLGEGEWGSASLRLQVVRILDDDEFGRFSLKAENLPPLNVFVSLEELGDAVDRSGMANGMLAAPNASRDGGSPLSQQALDAALGGWSLADAGLRLRVLDDSTVELVSERVFLEGPVEEAAMRVGGAARGILTYFVNSIEAGGKSTPYSFVAAVEGSPAAAEDSLHAVTLMEDEMMVSSWLAEDLRVEEGDSLTVRFFRPSPVGELAEDEARFRIRRVIAESEISADLTPPYPGLDGVENCRDWDPGIPVDLSRIRQKDEDYWDAYGAAPKAFIRFDKAQEMWGNRYGRLTAVRYTGASASHLETAIMSRLEPESLGIRFRPVRLQGLEASGRGVDFSQLFIGFSFFLLVASLLLTSLLFYFMMEQRTSERGLLFSLGFSRRQVRLIVLGEGLLLAAAGAFCGSFLAVVYDLAVLRGLGTVWQGAVGVSSLTLHVRPATVGGGMLVSTLAAWATMAAVIWRQSSLSPAALQRQVLQHKPPREERRGLKLGWALAAVSFAASAALLGLSAAGGDGSSAVSFFIAGGLLLACGLILCRILFLVWSRGPKPHGKDIPTKTGIGGLAGRNVGRNRGRSLLTAALLASGVFVVIAVGANRRIAHLGGRERDSGTGGFAYYAETDLPVFHDLEEEEGRDKVGLGKIFPGVSDTPEESSLDFVGFRVLDGDDASCLNLNRTENPRLLGVDPGELSEREAFRFVETEDWVDPEDPWSALRADLGPLVVPAVADQTVITWGLGKSVGDSLSYLDERGRRMEVRLIGGLANSIFQGNLIISEAAFRERFPSSGGKRVFLIDAPFGGAQDGEAQDVNGEPSDGHDDPLDARIRRSLRDYGIDLTSTALRLSEFNTVENTYLSIFLVLGGLGLLLGSVGLGIVVLRNIQEKRNEMALMRAVGFRRGWLWRMVVAQHGILVTAGILVGAVAGLAAALPALIFRASDFPYVFLAALLVGLAANGFAWISWSGFAALRGNLISALRNE